MQNTSTQPTNFNLSIPKITQVVRSLRNHRSQVPLKKQLSAQELIQRLELAINLNSAVTIQVNRSFYSEQVDEWTGQIYQGNMGQLYLYPKPSGQPVTITPSLIRHLSFQKAA